MHRRDFLKAAAAASFTAITRPGISPCADAGKPQAVMPKLKAQFGAYYFDGWAGKNSTPEDPAQPWTKNAPTHMRKRLFEEFADREPVWGWRDDTPEIMEKQIDLAADNGLAFWAFCWYFNPDPAKVDADPKHTGMKLFVKAKNNHRMKFCMLVANHDSHMLRKTENWKIAVGMWMPYLTHSQHLTIDGKPVVIIFNAKDYDSAGFEFLQSEARKAGLPGVAIVSCGALPPGSGFTHSTHYNVGIGWEKGLEEHKYADLIQTVRQSWKGTPQMPHIPCLVARWDKRPWEEKVASDDPKTRKMSWYFTGGTAELFAKHLADALAWMDANPGQTTRERLAIIYAWNELGEGGYLVPTRGDPQASYLKALKSVVMPDQK